MRRNPLLSVAFYPITTIYMGAVIGILLVADGHASFEVAIVALALLALMVMEISTLREVQTVHTLVNSQREEMVARIDQLVGKLEEHEIDVPPKDGNAE